MSENYGKSNVEVDHSGAGISSGPMCAKGCKDVEFYENLVTEVLEGKSGLGRDALDKRNKEVICDTQQKVCTICIK